MCVSCNKVLVWSFHNLRALKAKIQKCGFVLPIALFKDFTGIRQLWCINDLYYICPFSLARVVYSYAENRNILDYTAGRRSMRPSRPLSLTGSFDFPVGDLGCVYPYFCMEFSKGDSPSTDFQMQTSVACQPQTCQGNLSQGTLFPFSSASDCS